MSSVDVVVPCYNYGHYLKACVDSVLSQRDVDVRVLIIDDKSTDDSATVGQALAAADPRVTFRRHEVNQRHIATFNEGIIGWARADYTLLLSADDAIAPGALARASEVLSKNPDVGMVFGLALILSGESPVPEIPDERSLRYKIIPGPQFLKRSCSHGNPVPTPTAVIRTKLQHELGGYSREMLHTSDMEMWMRIATRASIAAIQATQGFYRLHSSNMSSNYYDRAVSDRGERIMTCKAVLDKWGQDVPDFPRWVDEMERTLALEALQLASWAYGNGELARSGELADFAAKHHPSLMSSPIWWKFMLKRMIGAPLIGKFRTARPPVPAEAQPEAKQQIGWWPEGGDAAVSN